MLPVPRGPDQSNLVGQIESGNEATDDIMPDNAFIEAFNGPLRAKCLNAHWFLSLADAREKLEDCRKYYNEEQPHGTIGNKPPIILQNHDGAASPPS